MEFLSIGLLFVSLNLLTIDGKSAAALCMATPNQWKAKNATFMSYTEEEQYAYMDVQHLMETFVKLKPDLRAMKCPEHQKKCKVEDSWENGYEVNIYISNYCCDKFAYMVGQWILDKKLFNHVFVEHS